MKKTIIAALVLAAAGFSKWSPDYTVKQIGYLSGCESDAGKSAVAILPNSQTNQFIITSTNPIYAQATTILTTAITTGKSINLLSRWFTTSSTADTGPFSYWVDGSCYKLQYFVPVEAIVLKQ